MRITALIAASAAVLALASTASAAPAPLHDLALTDGTYVMENDASGLRQDIDRGHIIGAGDSASMHPFDDSALGAAGHLGHAPLA